MLFLLLWAAPLGCVRRDGRNADCQWPGEIGPTRLMANHPGFREHIIGDLEFAEDLAIRYMDSRPGTRGSATAADAKNRCMGNLLNEIGAVHGLTAEEAFQFFGQRRIAVDLAMILPFFLVYGLAADVLVRRLRGRYPREEGLAAGVVIVLCSLAFALGGLLTGGFWSSSAESLRVGTGHLSNRALRLPWEQHRAEIFALLTIFFWVVAAVRYRVTGSAPAEKSAPPRIPLTTQGQRHKLAVAEKPYASFVCRANLCYRSCLFRVAPGARQDLLLGPNQAAA